MFGLFAKILGSALTAIGLSFQGLAMANGTPHALAIQLMAIVCTGLGGGLQLVAPSVVASVNVKAVKNAASPE